MKYTYQLTASELYDLSAANIKEIRRVAGLHVGKGTFEGFTLTTTASATVMQFSTNAIEFSIDNRFPAVGIGKHFKFGPYEFEVTGITATD